MKNQPRELFFLSFVQMCKLFSHYGVRASLVMYMISSLRFSETYSFGVSACFCGFFELMCFAGGAVADRYLGLPMALSLGGTILCLGYSSLLIEKGFFLSLGLIVLGNSLFSPSITALLGSAYMENDPRRQKGFTFFYMAQNVGACISILVCGFVAKWYGYPSAFAVASCGMILGRLVLLFHRNNFGTVRRANHSYSERPSKKIIYLTVTYLSTLILFFAASEQICSSLIVFAEEATEKTIWGFSVPSSLVIIVNPLVIITCGAAVARYRFGVVIPLLLIACSFATLSFLSKFSSYLSISSIAGIISVISIAELMLGPTVTSFISEVAAKKNPAAVMGLLSVSYAIASFLAGVLGSLVVSDRTDPMGGGYQWGFLKIALLCVAGAIVAKILILRSHAPEKAF